MEKKHKIISIILSSLMLLSILSVGVVAINAETASQLTAISADEEITTTAAPTSPPPTTMKETVPPFTPVPTDPLPPTYPAGPTGPAGPTYPDPTTPPFTPAPTEPDAPTVYTTVVTEPTEVTTAPTATTAITEPQGSTPIETTAPITSSPDEDEPLMGDVDRDGKVTVKDATLVQKYLADLAALDTEQLTLADLTQNGKVDIKDATAIQKTVANITDLSNLPPVAEGYNRYFFYLPLFWENDFSNGAGVYYEGGAAYPGLACTPTGYQTKHGKVYYCDLPEAVTIFCFNNMVDGGDAIGTDIYCSELKSFDIEAQQEGMIFILDTDKIVTNIYTGKTTYDGYWFYYYGNGEYGETPEKGVFVYTDPALNWICHDCTDLFG